jgi:hypothetical protein
MARKRKKASRRRSRRRMGALAPSLKNIDFMNIAGVVGGAVLSRVGKGAVTKMLPSGTKPQYISGGMLVAGALIPMFVKNRLVQSLATGFMAVSGADLLTDMGVVKITGSEFGEDVFGEDVLGGDMDIPVINGDDDIPVINGSEFGEDILGEDVLGEDDDNM